MTTTTLTLSEFLLARIAEDEASARKSRSTLLIADAAACAVVPSLEHYTFRHHERWEPARVLAECEAKRRIVELHIASVRAVSEGLSAQTRRAVQSLAAVYADHPDYRDEWRP